MLTGWDSYLQRAKVVVGDGLKAWHERPEALIRRWVLQSVFHVNESQQATAHLQAIVSCVRDPAASVQLQAALIMKSPELGGPVCNLRSVGAYRGGGDCRKGAAPKVVLRKEHLRLVSWHALHIVAPSPSVQMESCPVTHVYTEQTPTPNPQHTCTFRGMGSGTNWNQSADSHLLLASGRAAAT